MLTVPILGVFTVRAQAISTSDLLVRALPLVAVLPSIGPCIEVDGMTECGAENVGAPGTSLLVCPQRNKAVGVTA